MNPCRWVVKPSKENKMMKIIKDILVKRASKNFVDIEYKTKKYRVNKWGVICKQNNDNKYWTYAVLDFDSYRQCLEILETVCNLTDAKSYWVEGERAYKFN